MSAEFYRKLLDLYAAHELPLHLEEEMEIAALKDADLAYDMRSLRETYDTMRAEAPPEYTDETRQRIMMKLYLRGADLETAAPEPAHYQYALPIQG